MTHLYGPGYCPGPWIAPGGQRADNFALVLGLTNFGVPPGACPCTPVSTTAGHPWACTGGATGSSYRS